MSDWELAPGASQKLQQLLPPHDPVVERIGRDSGGYAMRGVDGSIYIPVIQMKRRGRGEGGRFLDSLPRDETIKVPGVINDTLRGMLERRGFHTEREWSKGHREWIEVYVRVGR